MSKTSRSWMVFTCHEWSDP